MHENVDGPTEYAMRCSPDAWFDIAKELKEACDCLLNPKETTMTISHGSLSSLKKFDHSRAWILLASFSLENAVKAILVLQNPMLVANGKLSKEISIGHNLTSLFAKVKDFDLSSREEQLIRIAQEASPQWGRYPAALKIDDTKAEQAYCDWMSQVLNRILIRIQNAIWPALIGGWVNAQGNTMTMKAYERDPITDELWEWRHKEVPECPIV